MKTGLRRLLIFGPPVMLGAINLMHPMVTSPVYPKVERHLRLWMNLHVANLLLFPLFGLAAYCLVKVASNRAANISKVAIGLFIPLYAAFDALAGLGTGTLVMEARRLQGDQLDFASKLIDGYWDSGLLVALAAAGSIAWLIGILAAAVAFTIPERRPLVATTAFALFVVTGWARGSIFQTADGMTIRSVWWLVTLGSSILMFLIGKPRVPGALLTLAGILFGAMHVPPTGPLGVACFIGAAAYLELHWRGDETKLFAGEDDQHSTRQRLGARSSVT
jgi:hypothetical protein